MRLNNFRLQITVSETRRQDTSEIYSKITLAQLQQSIPQFNWREFFYSIFLTDFDEDESIVFYSLSYFVDLGKLLETTERRCEIGVLKSLCRKNWLIDWTRAELYKITQFGDSWRIIYCNIPSMDTSRPGWRLKKCCTVFRSRETVGASASTGRTKN